MMILLLIIGGGLLLFCGGEVLIRGAVALSRSLGLSPLVIGLTVVAYGTSMPELVVSVKAALDGFPGLVLGNAIGSNMSNILLVLGATAIIYPLKSDKRMVNLDVVFLLAITMCFFLFSFKQVIDMSTSIIFLIAVVGYTFITFRSAKRGNSHGPEEQTEEIEEQLNVNLSLPMAILAVILGVGLLVVGADLFIDGAVQGARLFGISETTIGLTLVAFGTSAPELATSVVAAFRKHSDIALGNVVGSSIFNIAAILGVSGLISPLTIEDKLIAFDIPILLFTTIALLILLKHAHKISRAWGVVFCLGYTAYIAAQAGF